MVGYFRICPLIFGENAEHKSRARNSNAANGKMRKKMVGTGIMRSPD
jgi:hypothetical protein